MNRFLAGVGKALLIRGNELIGVARTLTDSTLEFAITAEDIRGGAANVLWGKYFHDSTLNVTLTDSMFNLEYIAASLGTHIQSGGISIAEEQVVATSGAISATQTPISVDGSVIGWYKLPQDEAWQVAVFNGQDISIPEASDNTVYCLKYFYQNVDARSIVITAEYVPSELHIVLIHDLFNGDIATNPENTVKVGRLITDLPRVQMNGSQNLSLTASGAATTSLSGSALAIINPDSCEDVAYYGTMTEEVYGVSWRETISFIAVANSEITLENGESETLIVYGITPTGNIRLSNSDCTFTIDSMSPSNIISVSSAGVVTAAASGTGSGIVVVTYETDDDSFSDNALINVVSEP